MSQFPAKIERRGLVWSIIVAIGLLVPACERDEPAGPPPPAPGTSVSPTTTAPTDETGPLAGPPAAADDRDDPDAPRALPRSNELRDWIKTQPVRVAGAGELDQLADSIRYISPRGGSLLAALEVFGLQRVAQCAYQRVGDPAVVHVVFVEAQTPDDAFGLFSLRTPTPGQFNAADRSFTWGDASGWQGNVYVELHRSPPKGRGPAASARPLLDRILFAVPAADPPLLVRACPGEKLAETKIWHVRSTAAFRVAVMSEGASIRPTPDAIRPSLEKLQTIDADTMDTRLGLSGSATLSVAAVPVAEDEPPNLVWLVQYSDPSAATAAYQRYQQVLKSPATDLDANTILREPKGAFLAGSWTADQESIQNLLHNLSEGLPQ